MWRRVLLVVLLLAPAGAVANGVESYWRSELLAVHPGGRLAWEARSLRGTDMVAVGWIAAKWPRYGKWVHQPADNVWLPKGRFGFCFFRNANEAIVGVPFWLPAALLLLAAWRVRRRRGRPAGVCHHCGYDLRATPEPGGRLLERCPECGAAAAEPAASSRR